MQSTTSIQNSTIKSSRRQPQQRSKSIDNLYSHYRYRINNCNVKDCQYDNNLRYSKSQIKSMSTLPTKNYLQSSRSGFKQNYITNLLKKPIKINTSFPSIQSMSYIKNNTNLRKISARDKKQKGYIYNSPHQSRYRYLKTQNQQNYQKQKQEQITKLEQQNVLLRSKLLDSQLKQREYVQRNNKLQKLCIKLQELIAKRKTMSKEQQQFLNVIKITFNDCFGITDYKQIWNKQKQILKDWMENCSDKLQETAQFKKNKEINKSNNIKQQENPQIYINEQYEQNLLQDDDQQIKIKINRKQRPNQNMPQIPIQTRKTKIRIQEQNPTIYSYPRYS